MAKMKIYEIAKSLDTKSSDLIKVLNENGFPVKSHNSNIEDDAIAFILKKYSSKAGASKEADENLKESAESKIQKEQKQTEQEPQETKKSQNVQNGDSAHDEIREQKSQSFEESQSMKKAQTLQKVHEEHRPETYQNEKAKQFPQNNQKQTSSQQQQKYQKQQNGQTANNQKQQNSYPVQNNQRQQNNQSVQNNQRPQNNQSVQNNQRPQNNQSVQSNQRQQNSQSGQNYQRQQNSQSVQSNQRQQNSQSVQSNQRPQNNQSVQNNQRPQNNQSVQNYQRPQNHQSVQNNQRPQNNQSVQSNQRPQNNQSVQNNQRQQNHQTVQNNQKQYNNQTSQYNQKAQSGYKGDSFANNSQGQNSGYNQKNNNFVFNGKNNFGGKNKKNKSNNSNNNNVQPKKDPNRKGAFIMPKPVVVEKEPDDGIKTIVLPEVITIKELADKIKIQPSAIVKKLFLLGKMVSINSEVSFEEAEEIAVEYNCIAEMEEKVDIIEELIKEEDDDDATLVKRPPVVCVMGHVDHGKTSLLDAIRATRVTDKEAGGITQHIGAYVVTTEGEKITFLDTPGHEAFTSMRMRGAQSTDIAILVVAADDGVMPQTVEAISHAKAAGVEIIVAVNKIDKPSANIERVKQELVEYELIAEDWGGNTVFVPVSAHTREGIDQLLEMIILTAEVCELKANPNRKARGIVIEAQLDKGRGPVATILVQKGSLHVGDSIVIGSAYGKVRAMMDDKGRRVKEATPSTPVEILGLNEVPDAGEIFLVQDNEKEARFIAEAYIKQGREKLLEDTKAKLSLDGLFSQIQAGNIKDLNLIVKADVQGSVEAVKQSLLKLSNDEVAIRIIHGGVGSINESDVTLASASNAIIIGFNVRPDVTAKDIAEREKVDLRLYRVIYNAIEDIEAAMKGMLDPIYEEKVTGHAEIRQVFKASGVGTIAGSYVLDGKIMRGSKARVLRDGVVIFDGTLSSLKRFKDDVKEVNTGYECGIVFEKFNDLKEFDIVEVFVMEEVPR